MDKDDYAFYKLYCKTNPDLVYIGSTTDFKERTHCHISSCNNPNDPNHHYKVYKTIRENGGWDNWIIEVIYFQEDLTERQARATEQVLMNDFGTLNEIRAYTDKKEYDREYKQKNKEAIAEYKKQYNQDNKEAIAQKNTQYRQDNKEAIAQQKTEKTTCECGSVFRKDNLARHRRSKKHLEFINKK